MFEYTKLISKEFLKQGKVFEMISSDSDCEDSLLNEVKLMESLLDDPQHSNNAQKRLTHLVYKYMGGYMNGYVETYKQNPETFVNYILHVNEPNEVDRSNSDFLPKCQLDPIIAQKVRLNFLQGDYDTAVFQAFKQIEVAVRNSGNYEETDIGVPLMRKAFHADTGNLTNPNQQPAEKEAIAHLFAGAIGYCKNPSSHRDVEITTEEAVELIGLASYLLRIVDSRKQSDGDWQEQFANRFVRHLKDRKSPLMDPEVFMGEGDRGYPRYIGFNIGKIEDLDIRDKDAFWLVASTIHDGKIYLKLQMNDSNCFNQLQSQKEEIEREFGDLLKWEPQGPGQYIRIGVDLEVDPLDENRGQWNQHFEKMREKLEKLNEIFQSRIEDAFSEDDTPFVSEGDIPF